MNWQDKLTIIVGHLVMGWMLLILLGLLSSFTIVMLKFAYNILIK